MHRSNIYMRRRLSLNAMETKLHDTRDLVNGAKEVPEYLDVRQIEVPETQYPTSH